ncbi:MAG: hypothetical protein HZC37_04180 [Burkholderiales bacterium]|nr:hypothetical protein [Burkholderiales bacterium]
MVAALDELVGIISGVPEGTLERGQRESLLAKLGHARRHYLAGAICRAHGHLGHFLDEARSHRRGHRKALAEDLGNRGYRLRDSLFDHFFRHPSRRRPHCFDHAQREAPRVTIEASDDKHFKASVAFGRPKLWTVQAGGETWTQLSVPGLEGQIGAKGLPALPSWQTLIAVPRGSTPELVTRGRAARVRDRLQLNLYPFQPQPVDQAREEEREEDRPSPETFMDKPFAKDEKAYATDAFSPAEPCAARLIGSMRDLHIVQVQCTAGQYNPVTNELRMFESVQFDVRFRGGEGVFATSQSLSAFEKSSQVGMKSVLNRDAVGRYVKFVDPQLFACLGEELLVLTHPNFRAPSDTLATWKKSKGISTTVIEVGAGTTYDTADKITKLIRARYDTCLTRVSYVLLMGDAEWVPPSRTDYPNSSEPDSTTGSDWNYATYPHLALLYLDALFPYFAVGRIPVDTLTEANTVVNKIVHYEASPPFINFGSGGPFYTTATMASYFQCCRTDVTQAGRDMRSFVETSETVRNTLVGSGYTVQRIYNSNTDYQGNPVSDTTPRRYFDGDALPAALAPGSGFGWNGTTTDIVNAFNAGRFLITHRDHGGSSQWADPPFSTGNLGSLSNGALLPVIYSINCKSAYWERETDGGGSAESLMEQLLLKADGGMVGGIGDVRNSPTWPNSALLRGFIDATWPSLASGFGDGTRKRRLGDILNHGKLYLGTQIGVAQPAGDVTVTDYTDEIILYHVIGDPTLEMWTGNPHRLTLTQEFALAVLAGSLQVEYAHEGAEITALLLQDDGSAVPVGRGTVRRGAAVLPFISPALQQVDPKRLILSASRENAVSVELRGTR